jgi:hypothetical protein
LSTFEFWLELKTKCKGKTLLVNPNQSFLWFDQQCFALHFVFSSLAEWEQKLKTYQKNQN